LGRGISHIEAHIGKPNFTEVISDCNWISGHVVRATFEENLASIESKKYFTFVRSPTEQLISHIKWQFAIFDKGKKFFLSHPLKNQIIALEAMNLNYENPSEVIGFLDRYRGLFLNFQSQYILSNPKVRLSADTVKEECSFFSMIGTTSNAYKLLSGFLGLDLREKRENENKESYFNEKVFYDNDISSFISEHNARDTFIYNIVKNEIEPRFMEEYESRRLI
jgi:hypothetical protein